MPVIHNMSESKVDKTYLKKKSLNHIWDFTSLVKSVKTHSLIKELNSLQFKYCYILATLERVFELKMSSKERDFKALVVNKLATERAVCLWGQEN